MAIQWYPGHMHKAQREIGEVMPKIDLVIEVLDARLPQSSSNPLIHRLRGGKPCLKILNKSDLADPGATRAWVKQFGGEAGVKAIEFSAKKPQAAKTIPSLCRMLVPNRGTVDKPLRAMIVGIPNVGKSTLINLLLGRKVAHVADEPAVTKMQLKVTLDKGMQISDTPGIMWPKIEDEAAGFRLAASGAIGRNAMDVTEVARFAAAYLLEHYREPLRARYKLPNFEIDAVDFLEHLAKNRGFLKPGGEIDYDKASQLFLKEMRSGLICRISLETPEK